MVTMVTVWAVCCYNLLHIKVHDLDFILMCHLLYSVQRFGIHGENESDMSISVPTQSRLSHAFRFQKQDRMFVYIVAMENEIIGIFKFLICYHMWCTE